jgi:hypothetical protein
MVAAANSKQHKYQPRKYMLQSSLTRHAAPDAEDREPLTGEQVMDAFRRIGFPVVDVREAN